MFVRILFPCNGGLKLIGPQNPHPHSTYIIIIVTWAWTVTRHATRVEDCDCEEGVTLNIVSPCFVMTAHLTSLVHFTNVDCRWFIFITFEHFLVGRTNMFPADVLHSVWGSLSDHQVFKNCSHIIQMMSPLHRYLWKCCFFWRNSLFMHQRNLNYPHTMSYSNDSLNGTGYYHFIVNQLLGFSHYGANTYHGNACPQSNKSWNMRWVRRLLFQSHHHHHFWKALRKLCQD